MAYSTIADIELALPEDKLIDLTDDEGINAVDDTKITQAITGADGEIDGYLAERHTTPLSTVPTLIKGWSIDIAIYKLYQRRMEEIPDTRDKAYSRAIKKLERISEGKMKLPIDVPADDFGLWERHLRPFLRRLAGPGAIHKNKRSNLKGSCGVKHPIRH